MGTICSSPLLGSLVDLNVLNDQIPGIEALRIGIGFCVSKEPEQELSRLDWPPSESDAEWFSYESYQQCPLYTYFFS